MDSINYTKIKRGRQTKSNSKQTSKLQEKTFYKKRPKSKDDIMKSNFLIKSGSNSYRSESDSSVKSADTNKKEIKKKTPYIKKITSEKNSRNKIGSNNTIIIDSEITYKIYPNFHKIDNISLDNKKDSELQFLNDISRLIQDSDYCAAAAFDNYKKILIVSTNNLGEDSGYNKEFKEINDVLLSLKKFNYSQNTSVNQKLILFSPFIHILKSQLQTHGQNISNNSNVDRYLLFYFENKDPSILSYFGNSNLKSNTSLQIIYGYINSFYRILNSKYYNDYIINANNPEIVLIDKQGVHAEIKIAEYFINNYSKFKIQVTVGTTLKVCLKCLIIIELINENFDIELITRKSSFKMYNYKNKDNKNVETNISKYIKNYTKLYNQKLEKYKNIKEENYYSSSYSKKMTGIKAEYVSDFKIQFDNKEILSQLCENIQDNISDETILKIFSNRAIKIVQERNSTKNKKFIKCFKNLFHELNI